MPFPAALKRTLTGALMLCGLAIPALAGPVTEAAVEIEARQDQGDYAGAWSRAQDLLGAIWNQNPGIGFTQALLATESAPAFGVYNPRPTDQFKPGEQVVIYAEPWGFVWAALDGGIWQLDIAVDLAVLDPAGNLIGSFADVTRLTLASRAQNREFHANLLYTLNGIAPGKYRLQTTLRDMNSARTGSFETPVEILP